MFAEALPEGCPPPQTREPELMAVFRLVEKRPPQALDFDSHAARWPDVYGSNCRHYALSVFTARESLARLLGLPAHAGKIVARLVLTPASGRVQQTGRDPHHCSWWRYEAFDVLAACEVEGET